MPLVKKGVGKKKRENCKLEKEKEIKDINSNNCSLLNLLPAVLKTEENFKRKNYWSGLEPVYSVAKVEAFHNDLVTWPVVTNSDPTHPHFLALEGIYNSQLSPHNRLYWRTFP